MMYYREIIKQTVRHFNCKNDISKQRTLVFFVAFTSSWKNWSRKPVCRDNWEWEPACWGSWEWEPAYWGSWERKPVKRGRSYGGSGKRGWRSKWAGRVRKWWSSYTTERRLNYPPKKREVIWDIKSVLESKEKNRTLLKHVQLETIITFLWMF